MNTAILNTTRLNAMQLNSSWLDTLFQPSGRKGGAIPPEPGEENAWLWGDGTPVLWGDGSTVLIEQNV